MNTTPPTLIIKPAPAQRLIPAPVVAVQGNPIIKFEDLTPLEQIQVRNNWRQLVQTFQRTAGRTVADLIQAGEWPTPQPQEQPQ